MSCFSLAYGQLTLKRVLGDVPCDQSLGMTQPAEVSLARIVCTLFMLARSSISPSRTCSCRLISSMCLRRRMFKLLSFFSLLRLGSPHLISIVEVVSSEVTLSYVSLLQNKFAKDIHVASSPPSPPPFFFQLTQRYRRHLQVITTFLVQLSYITITLVVFLNTFLSPSIASCIGIISQSKIMT